MLAPQEFVLWMSANVHQDEFGEYRYHPSSDALSKALCLFVLEDLLDRSTTLREQAKRRSVVYGINTRFLWKSLGKRKTLDLALGIPGVVPEHGAMQPRARRQPQPGAADRHL